MLGGIDRRSPHRKVYTEARYIYSAGGEQRQSRLAA